MLSGLSKVCFCYSIGFCRRWMAVNLWWWSWHHFFRQVLVVIAVAKHS